MEHSDNRTHKHPYLALMGWMLLYLAVIPIVFMVVSGYFPEPLRQPHECTVIMSCLEWQEGFLVSGLFFLLPIGVATFLVTLVFTSTRKKPWVPRVVAIKSSLWVTIAFVLAAVLIVAN